MERRVPKKKNNNKGFSLVELIIVIAIMAVLLGLVSVNFVRYYNKACVTTDVTNAKEMAKQIEAAISDRDGNTVPTEIRGTGGTAVTGVDGLTVLPYSKRDKGAEWVINTTFGNGVVEIKLGGYLIYPDGGGDNEYYNHYCPD